VGVHLVGIECDCGAAGETEPGTVWACPACGHPWQVPALSKDQQESLARLGREHRTRVLGTLYVAIALGVAPLVIGDVSATLVAGPAVVIGWGVVVLPLLRRRYRHEVDGLPQVTVGSLVPRLGPHPVRGR
jgi:hypothetical protein